ncbi:hypothetical protein [Rhizorhapis sp. SPR117]|uniref:hypothetical protein n=1 Tax=Rhizorhapis sp. SPR117 TaxID=2912611 RepID=UPI00403EB7D0
MFNLCSSTWPKSQLRADWALFAGSSFVAALGANWIIAVVVLAGLFLLCLSRALRAFQTKS